MLASVCECTHTHTALGPLIKALLHTVARFQKGHVICKQLSLLFHLYVWLSLPSRRNKVQGIGNGALHQWLRLFPSWSILFASNHLRDTFLPTGIKVTVESLNTCSVCLIQEGQIGVFPLGFLGIQNNVVPCASCDSDPEPMHSFFAPATHVLSHSSLPGFYIYCEVGQLGPFYRWGSQAGIWRNAFLGSSVTQSF